MPPLPRLPGATAPPLWVLSALLFAAGWALAFTFLGAALLYAGTAVAVAILALRRTRGTFVVFAVVMTLGWLPAMLAAFITSPLILGLGALLLAWVWLRRRGGRPDG